MDHAAITVKKTRLATGTTPESVRRDLNHRQSDFDAKTDVLFCNLCLFVQTSSVKTEEEEAHMQECWVEKEAHGRYCLQNI
jgi:hypothetical protein